MSKVVCSKFTCERVHCSDFCILVPCVVDNFIRQKADEKVRAAMGEVLGFLNEIKKNASNIPEGISFEFSGVNLGQIDSTIQALESLKENCGVKVGHELYLYFEKNGRYGAMPADYESKDEPAVPVKESEPTPSAVKKDKPAESFKDALVQHNGDFKKVAKGSKKNKAKVSHIHYALRRSPGRAPIRGCENGKKCTDPNCKNNHSCIAKKCNYGKNCNFFHPSDGDKFYYNVCAFGEICSNGNCPFLHVPENATVYAPDCPTCREGKLCPDDPEFAISKPEEAW